MFFYDKTVASPDNSEISNDGILKPLLVLLAMLVFLMYSEKLT